MSLGALKSPRDFFFSFGKLLHLKQLNFQLEENNFIVLREFLF